MKILTAQQMREIDRLTVERCGISYATLMETAGARVVEAIVSHFGEDVINDEQWAVFCGKGNNGGDGAVVARLLWMKGAAQVRVYLFGKLDEISGEARVNLDAVKRISTEEATEDVAWRRMIFREITSENDTEELFKEPAGVFIDALLGTGVKRKVEGVYAKAVEAINYWGGFGFTKIVSIDIPSGLSSDSPHPIGPYVRPDLTVTLTAPKIANATCADGNLVVASIGTPWWLLDKIESPFEITEEPECREFLRRSRRAPDAHKGSVGDVLLIAGSRGKTGAAALASGAILRAGAGLVTVATSRSAQSLLVTQAWNEVMTEALDETPDGAISHPALGRALQLAQKRTVVAVGPGLSSADESTRRFVRDFVGQRNTPLVIDADGLNALAPWPEELQGSEEMPIVITPHPGEMARLTGMTIAEVNADRIAVARGFAEKHRVITVLKVNRTVIAAPLKFADPDYRFTDVYIVPTGNAGMATAGSGDVLTGIIASFLAQSPRLTDEIKLGSGSRDAVVSAVY